MELPIKEASVIVSIIITIFWAYIKFIHRRIKPDSEDVVDMIGLLLIGVEITAGVLLIATAFDLVSFAVLEELKAHIGLSGAILIGAGIYFYYLAMSSPVRKTH